MHKPSALILNRVYPPDRGATGRLAQDLADMLINNGWHVTVIKQGSDNLITLDGTIKVLSVKHTQSKESVLSTSRLLKALLKLGKRQTQVDCVISMTDPPLLATTGHKLAKYHGCKHIHWCQDVYPDLLKPLGIKIPQWVYNGAKAKQATALKNADALVAIGRDMADFVRGYGIAQDRIHTIPNWVASSVLKAHKKENFNALSKSPFEEQVKVKDIPKFRVLYAGRLGRVHSTRTIFDAAAALVEVCPDVEFVFMGDPDGFDAAAKRYNKKIPANIRVLPFQPADKLRRIMETGDVHLMSMKNEALNLLVPSKFYGALAVHRPSIFIGPKSCEIARVIREYKAGNVIANGDSAQLIDIIKHYRYDENTWFNAQKGAAAAADVYSRDNGLKQWLELVTQIYESPLA